MAKTTDFATVTTKTLQVYANGSTGNDTNDGLTVGTPKLTLGAVFALVPDIVKHNVCVNLAGTLTDWGAITLSRTALAWLFVDGGTNTTTLAGPYTADIHETYSIGLTTAGWTANAYRGYSVKVTSGACNGEIRTIQSHTTTTITPTQNFSTDPGAATFVIVRPTTTLSASSTESGLTISNLGDSVGQITVQNIYLTGSKAQLSAYNSCGEVAFANVVSDSTKQPPIVANWLNLLLFSSNVYDSSTFALNTLYHTGVTVRGNWSTSLTASVYHVQDFYVYGGLLNCLDCNSCGSVFMTQGWKISGMYLWHNLRVALMSASGFAKGEASGCSNAAGLQIRRSFVTIYDYVNISSNGAQGMVVDLGSIVQIYTATAALSGSGNVGWGVLCDYDATVLYYNTITPTLTGAGGEVYTATGAGTATWAQIAAGTILSGATYKCLVRKY